MIWQPHRILFSAFLEDQDGEIKLIKKISEERNDAE